MLRKWLAVPLVLGFLTHAALGEVPRMVSDITPGQNGQGPGWLTVYDGALYFGADDRRARAGAVGPARAGHVPAAGRREPLRAAYPPAVPVECRPAAHERSMDAPPR